MCPCGSNEKGLQEISSAAAVSKFETLDALSDTIDPGDLGRFAVEMEQLWNCGVRKLSCGKRLLNPNKPGFYEMHAKWQDDAAAQCKGARASHLLHHASRQFARCVPRLPTIASTLPRRRVAPGSLRSARRASRRAVRFPFASCRSRSLSRTRIPTKRPPLAT